jgi:hypothetical protein
MNWEFTNNELKVNMNELRVNYESCANIYMNEHHSSCENGVCDIICMLKELK